MLSLFCQGIVKGQESQDSTFPLVQDGKRNQENLFIRPKELQCDEISYLPEEFLKNADWLNWNKDELASIFISYASKQEIRNGGRTWVWMYWSMRGLYIKFFVLDGEVKSKRFQNDHKFLSRDDVVEFLIDPRGDADTCWAEDDRIYHFNSGGIVKDDSGSDSCKTNPFWNGNGELIFFSKVQVDCAMPQASLGYFSVLFVPFSDFFSLGTVPSVIHINIATGNNGYFYDWVGLTRFRNPKFFKKVFLIKK